MRVPTPPAGGAKGVRWYVGLVEREGEGETRAQREGNDWETGPEAVEHRGRCMWVSPEVYINREEEDYGNDGV